MPGDLANRVVPASGPRRPTERTAKRKRFAAGWDRPVTVRKSIGNDATRDFKVAPAHRFGFERDSVLKKDVTANPVGKRGSSETSS
jgi:hypothetical protein